MGIRADADVTSHVVSRAENTIHAMQIDAASSLATAPESWPLDVQRTDESGEVDLEQLEHQLSLTLAERLDANDRWLQFIRIVQAAGRQLP